MSYEYEVLKTLKRRREIVSAVTMKNADDADELLREVDQILSDYRALRDEDVDRWQTQESRKTAAEEIDNAVEQFEKALAQDPKFVPAVYNLTLLFLRLDLLVEAQARQERYLTLDPDSEWADEIRRLVNLD